MAMKGKKPTYQQRKVIEKAGYDTYQWLVQKDTDKYLQIVNRETKEEVKIHKCGNQD